MGDWENGLRSFPKKDIFDGRNIISYLFGYKIRLLSLTDKLCGFPVVAYYKVISNIENRCINYIVIDKAHNYEELDKMNYKKKNKYEDVFEKANNYINKLDRIEKIKNYLLIKLMK